MLTDEASLNKAFETINALKKENHPSMTSKDSKAVFVKEPILLIE